MFCGFYVLLTLFTQIDAAKEPNEEFIFDIPAIEQESNESVALDLNESTKQITRVAYYKGSHRTSFDSILQYLNYVMQPRLVFMEELYPNYPYDEKIGEDELWRFSGYYKVGYRSDGSVRQEEHFEKKELSNEFIRTQENIYHYNEAFYDSDKKRSIQSIRTSYIFDIPALQQNMIVYSRLHKDRIAWQIFYVNKRFAYAIYYHYTKQGSIQKISKYNQSWQKDGIWSYFSTLGRPIKEEVWHEDHLIKYSCHEGLGFSYYNNKGKSVTEETYHQLTIPVE